MKGENILYETLYQSILTQLYSGVLRRGRSLPSQQELCRQYNVGITTVRRVIRMLEEDGLIQTASGKRAVVCLDEGNRSYIASLLQRRESIRDIYGGLELLMPALYAGGAALVSGYAGLREILDGLGGEMDQVEIYNRAVEFFTGLLLPYQNPVILDLQSDMEHYARIPYLPGSHLPDPFAITADPARGNLLSMLAMAEEGRTRDLTLRLERMYQDSGRRVDDYLAGLGKQFPAGQAEVPYRWFVKKVRAHLYAIVARNLYRRTKAGEFQGRAYLPSVPEIMDTYQVSKSTACNAVALLSDIGFVRALDKKGIVRREGGELPPLRIDEKVIKEHLILHMDILQILAVCSRQVAYATVSALDGQALQTIRGKWKNCHEIASTASLVQLLLAFFQCYAPYRCLRNIFDHFDDTLIWGHYLHRSDRDKISYQEPEQEIERQFSALCSALDREDWERFSLFVQSIFQTAYRVSRRHVAELVDPERLPRPLAGS